jgi:hypothetical protein
MANIDKPLINIVTENKPKVPDCHEIVVSCCSAPTLPCAKAGKLPPGRSARESLANHLERESRPAGLSVCDGEQSSGWCVLSSKAAWWFQVCIVKLQIVHTCHSASYR